MPYERFSMLLKEEKDTCELKPSATQNSYEVLGFENILYAPCKGSISLNKLLFSYRLTIQTSSK